MESLWPLETSDKSARSCATPIQCSRFKRRLVFRKHGRILSRFTSTPRSAPAMTQSTTRMSRSWEMVLRLLLDLPQETAAQSLTCHSSKIVLIGPRVQVHSTSRSTATATQASALCWLRLTYWSMHGTSPFRSVEQPSLQCAYFSQSHSLQYPPGVSGNEPCSIENVRWRLRNRLHREHAQRRLCRRQARAIQRPSCSSAHSDAEAGGHRHAYAQCR